PLSKVKIGASAYSIDQMTDEDHGALPHKGRLLDRALLMFVSKGRAAIGPTLRSPSPPGPADSCTLPAIRAAMAAANSGLRSKSAKSREGASRFTAPIAASALAVVAQRA